MKKYILLTDEGFTKAPDSTHVENFQVIDIVEANSPNEAFNLSEIWLEMKKYGFTKEGLICYELGERVIIEK